MRKLIRVFALVLSLALAIVPARARTVWIDTDLSLGSPLREVDDGYALLLALRSPELRVAGISTSYGNAPLAGTTARTRKTLAGFGLTKSVAAGAAAAAERGRVTPASEALAAALREERLTYVALGPLTNLATFLQLHPREAERIEKVIFLGGKTPEATLGFGPGKRFRIHDANVHKDPEAVREVLDAQVPLELVPIETASRLQIDRADLRRLEGGGAAGRYLAQRSRVWLGFWTHFAQARGGPIFDALVVVAAAQPALLSRAQRSATLESDGQLLVRQKSRAGRTVTFCTDFSTETKALVLRRLSAR